jgi:hypothetical protein
MCSRLSGSKGGLGIGRCYTRKKNKYGQQQALFFASNDETTTIWVHQVFLIPKKFMAKEKAHRSAPFQYTNHYQSNCCVDEL